MSIAVVSADRNLVESCQTTFRAWGVSPFYHFKSILEFNFKFGRSQKQFALVLMDGELPIAEQILIRAEFSKNPAFRSSVLGWIGSSEPPSQHALQDFHFRVYRPLGLKALYSGIFAGAQIARSRRSEIFQLGPSITSEWPSANDASDPELWKILLNRGKVGILLVQPQGLSASALMWLRRIRRMPSGRNLLVAGIGKTPETLKSIRTLCDAYVPKPASHKEWVVLAKKLRQRLLSSMESSFHVSAFRTSRRRGDLSLAKWHLQLLEKRFPDLYETKILASQLHLSRGNREKATRMAREAAAINPCRPDAYSILLRSGDSDAAEKARLYCPDCTSLTSPTSSIGGST